MELFIIVSLQLGRAHPETICRVSVHVGGGGVGMTMKAGFTQTF